MIHQSSFDVYRSLSGGTATIAKPPIVNQPSAIPTFFIPRKDPATEAQRAFLTECRQMELQERLTRLVDTQKLWELLLQNRVGVEDGAEARDYDAVRLTYPKYRQVVMSLIPEECYYSHNMLSPKAFLQFERDNVGSVSAVYLFTYIAKKVLLYRLRITMESHSCAWVSPPRLSQGEFEEFLVDILPHLRTVSAISETTKPYWLCHATKKVFAMLDHQKRGVVYVDDIMQSDVFAELLKLYEVDIEDAVVGPGEVPRDLETNWFALHQMERIFNHYGELDEDRNGMLSFTEVSKYQDECFTKTFLERVFEVHPSFRGELDYPRFLEFVIATENLDTVFGQRYVWRALDLADLGFLSRSVLRVFFTDVAKELRARMNLEVVPDDMVSEIFDMVHPTHPEQMTFKDVADSGLAHTVLSILIDHREFFQYDNRENAVVASAKAGETYL